MKVRSSRPPWLRTVAMGFVGIWALGMGCNPGLITALGGNATSTITPPDGYIVILVLNASTLPIQVKVDTTKENGAVDSLTIGAIAPSTAFAVANDCDVAAIQVTTFGYIGTGGLVESPSNIGALTGIACGKVVTITAIGTPPTFSIKVY